MTATFQMYILFNTISRFSAFLIFTYTHSFSRVKSSLEVTSVATFLLLCSFTYGIGTRQRPGTDLIAEGIVD